MFAQSTPLIDFIEMRNDRCEGSTLTNGILLLTAELQRNPDSVLSILTHEDRMIPASNLLFDLAEKINKHNKDIKPNCVTSLQLLYDKCLDRLVKNCIFSFHDLGRCIDAMPAYKNKILNIVISDKKQMQTILSSLPAQGTEKTLLDLVRKYPEYSEQFTSCFQQNQETLKLG